MPLTKAWLAEFLLVREMFSGPIGSPLHTYKVTREEYESLSLMLRRAKLERESPAYSKYWAAGFCLFVAEKYRREYDAGEGGWSWQGFERPLEIELTPQNHRDLVISGLQYWRRPVRERSGGLDYLGSLFDEGGLPWKLIQTGHGFGRAVRSGIKKYYNIKEGGGDLIAHVSGYQESFPAAFRTMEKYQLIASIVEWLMNLAEKHPLAEQEDPANYLDQQAAGWREASPLSVGEENGRALVNEWLRDAGKRKNERKLAVEETRHFTCDHRLEGELSSWALITDAYLPEEVVIELEDGMIESTRISVAFFEGDQLLSRSGVVYGTVSEDRKKLVVALSVRQTSLRRMNPELPVTIQFLSNGQSIHACYFENSDVDYQNLPLIFSEEGSEKHLVGTSSVQLTARTALLRLPTGMHYQTLREPKFRAVDCKEGQWIEVDSETVLATDQLRVILQLNSPAAMVKPRLKGPIAPFDTLPNLTYSGWPALDVESLQSDDSTAVLYAGEVPVTDSFCRSAVGTFTLRVIGKEGETLARRKVGVLPRGLRITSIPASAQTQARFLIRSPIPVKCKIANPELHVESDLREDEIVLYMASKPGEALPERVNLEISTHQADAEPVTLRLPYPQIGVHLFDDNEEKFLGNRLVVNDLVGMRMVLTPPPETQKSFHIVLEIAGLSSLSRQYSFLVSGEPKSLSLFAFQDDLQQMLGTKPDQDLQVKFRVETDRPLKQFWVSHYMARIEGLSSKGEFKIDNGYPSLSGRDIGVLGIRLDDPLEAPVRVEERTSQGVGVGVFDIPERMRKNGPWLVVPSRASAVQFRPVIWANEINAVRQDYNNSTSSLHSAAKLFHPIHNAGIIDSVIKEMASNFQHTGWNYLLALRDKYYYLPLSVFEPWRALSRNREAISAAAFRLEFDGQFAKRLSNELAVTWEAVTVDSWLRAQDTYHAFLSENGISDCFSKEFVAQRRAALSSSVPCFSHLSSYFGNPVPDNLIPIPLDTPNLIPEWYQQLRRRHAEDDRWPELMAHELTAWVNTQSLPSNIQQLADIHFARAVTYLPIFLAYVSAGRVLLTELSENLPELQFAIRVLSDFDRDAWYEPVYAMVLSHLLLNPNE